MTDSEHDQDTQELNRLLEYLKRTRGFDFSGYKRSSLGRRMWRRMQILGLEQNYSDYLDYLEVHPDEFTKVFNTLLINVTGFFRDRSVWDFLATDVLPSLISRKNGDTQIRIWSAGCASGEEAYSAAMLLEEALGTEQFRERVKIYATDLDEEALTYARQAAYTARDVGGVSEERLSRYFQPVEHRYLFSKELRRAVIFGRHDLLQDAPISRIDLLLCRNTLMYFNAEAQSRILARFHFALHDYGFLTLGKAELLLGQSNMFQAIDLKRRIFTKATRVNLRDRMLVMAQTGQEEVLTTFNNQVRLREAALETEPTAQLIVDTQGNLAFVNERARLLFALTSRDIGRPLQDFEISYRPVELRSLIEQVYAERRTIQQRNIELLPNGGGTLLPIEVVLIPLLDSPGNLLGVSVSFRDISRYKQLQDALEQANQDLEMAYEELQATNEELETTIEELQATVEELETTNEELQFTNEELETMNEELQSTNEELHTINDELHLRSEELNQVYAFTESILASMEGAVVVLDRDLHVQSWNRHTEELWGLPNEEVRNRHFLNLDIGLPVEQLRQPIRACLTGEAGRHDTTLKARRRGQALYCQVSITPLIDARGAIQGVILVMDPIEGDPLTRSLTPQPPLH